MILSALIGVALAADPIERPEPPAAVEGECSKVVPINRGQSIPISPSGIADCSALAVPLSQYADLLNTEKWAVAMRDLYRIDTSELERERDWYKARFEEESKPPPWFERPAVQRWTGRLETLVTVGIVAASLGAAYQYGNGGLR